MLVLTIIMRIKILHYSVFFQRWSFVVPLLCYLTFFCMIWVLSVPLKSNLSTVPVKIKTQGVEDTFNVNLKNSNFNSDRTAEESLLNEKNEYLVNVNDKDNKHKNQAEILEDVFKRYSV